MTKYLGLTAVAVVVVGFGAWVILATPTHSDPEPPSNATAAGSTGADELPEEADATLVFTAATHGYTELCGCSPDQTGGLPRRETLFESIDGPRLFVDIGAILPPADHLAYELKAAQVAGYYKFRPYDAVNVSRWDLQRGMDEFRSKLGDQKLVSASLDVEDVDVRARRTVTVGPVEVGVVGLSALDADGEVVDSLAPTLDDVLGDLRGSTDAVVVLVESTGGVTPELGSSLRSSDLVLVYGGESLALLSGAKVVGIPEMFRDKVGVVPATVRESGSESHVTWGDVSIHLLDDSYGDDPDVTTLFAEISERVVPTLPQPQLLDDSDMYAGSQSCQTCHPQEYQQWRASGHADAFSILEREKVSNRPDCVPCHTLGFDSDEVGYHAQDVHCENCHGPRKKHTVTNGQHTPDVPEARDRCVECHDETESPNFYYPTYWEAIKHGAGSY